MSEKESITQGWTARLGEILSEVTGSHPVIRQTPLDEDDPRAQMLWWRSSAPGVSIGVSETDADLLLQMRRRDLQEELPDSARAGLCDILDRSWGRGEMTGQSPADTSGCEVYQAEFATGGHVRFFVAQAATVQNGAVQTSGASPEGPNLDMLMDIELPITLRFGSTQMALKDIAGLNTGSVIEFDRKVDEPVEVMVNGHVVARGEAVVVRGSYAIRISEISSRQERLLTSSAIAAQDGDARRTGEQIQ